jgi:hypothetical protein
MNENREYQFKLLTETSASEDLFEDKTHQKIADTLYNVIHNGYSGGITIGLEGGWGSGKSTVVSILRNKLKPGTLSDAIYFYFDAWEHEGDPLRRIFLEALIDQVINADNKNILDKTDIELLEEKKKKISKRQKTSHIKTKRSATELGKLLTIAALLVPLGVAMVSGTVSKTVLQWGGTANLQFVLGTLLALAPLVVIVVNFFRLLFNPKKKVCDLKNWIFLQGHSEEDVTQEVSEDHERSSIEFERYFYEILDVIFSKNKDTKLLIVIDNLDRVDASDSLKIWSTLQTFLQHRNPNPFDKVSLYSKRIWVLVPYDEEGLGKLWDNQSPKNEEGLGKLRDNQSPKKENEDSITKKNDNANKGCAKSFFDKCFQLRIEVPKLVLTGWESFCKDSIDQALTGWNENEKKDALDVLKWTRESIDDIPSPRDIKTYVNQIGLLRQHCDSQISTIAVAYFAIEKYLNFRKNSYIENGLINGWFPYEKNKPLLPSQLTDDLCGILFGVSAKKGQQLLLEPEIEKALVSGSKDEIQRLLEIHKNAFWTVFIDFHLPKIINFQTMMKYSYSVWNGLWEASPDRCGRFVEYLKASVSQVAIGEFPTNENLKNYIAVFSMLDIAGYDLSKIWLDIIKLLNVQMKKNDFDHLSGNKILSDLASCQTRKKITMYKFKDVPFDNWIKWAAASSSSDISSYLLVMPPNSIVDEITTNIKAGSPIPERLHDLIAYMVHGGEKSWQPVINAIKSHIEWNQGIPSGNVFSVETYRILMLLSEKNENIIESLGSLVINGCFFNLAFHLNAQGATKYAALLLAKCFPDKLDSVNIPIVDRSADGLQNARNFWKTRSVENAQFIWDEVKPNCDFGYIWDLASDKTNKLVGDIIRIAVKENCPEFFNYETALTLLKEAIQITDNENDFNIELIKCFISNAQIEKEIIETNDLDIIPFAYELNILVKNTNDKGLIDYLIRKINSVTGKQWDKALREDIYLTTLAVSINEKSAVLSLANDLYNSLSSYLQAWISKSVTPSEMKQRELPNLIAMLGKDFNQQLKNRLTEHLTNISFKGSPTAVSFLLGYINIENIVTENRNKIQSAAEDAITNSDIETLKILDVILSHQDSAKFNPQQHLANIFRTPMKTLLYTKEGIDIALVERLALKFKVDISANSSDLIILSATYGKDDKQKDVTDIVKTFVKVAAGKIVSFPVENETFGGDDPFVGVVKEIKITYSFLGKEKAVTFQEHKIVTIP